MTFLPYGFEQELFDLFRGETNAINTCTVQVNITQPVLQELEDPNNDHFSHNQTAPNIKLLKLNAHTWKSAPFVPLKERPFTLNRIQIGYHRAIINNRPHNFFQSQTQAQSHNSIFSWTYIFIHKMMEILFSNSFKVLIFTFFL
jgi:hypothetical protein